MVEPVFDVIEPIFNPVEPTFNVRETVLIPSQFLGSGDSIIFGRTCRLESLVGFGQHDRHCAII